ncbi:hypothetical protein FRC01_005091 [Tulasnella sp. 417]|nr:hypothetical protein FRC01_005091 [Tulasnella sp. 417]
MLVSKDLDTVRDICTPTKGEASLKLKTKIKRIKLKLRTKIKTELSTSKVDSNYFVATNEEANKPSKAYSPVVHQPDKRPTLIDDLPAEIFQLVIFFTAAPDGPTDLYVNRVCYLQMVSRRWALLIESCPYLWASVRFQGDLRTMSNWIKKSKETPLSIHATPCFPVDPLYEQCVTLVAKNVHRWRFAEFDKSFPDFIKKIDNPPCLLEALSMWDSEIPADCKLFQGWGSKLQELRLTCVTLPPDFAALVGLTVLRLRKVTQRHANGGKLPMAIEMVQRALEACPNLVDLLLGGPFTISEARTTTKPVVLKELQNLCLSPEQGQNGALLSLIDAENCSNLTIGFRGRMDEKPQEWKWSTYLQILRRAGALRIHVPGIYPMIRIESIKGPCRVDIMYSDGRHDPDVAQQAAYSIMEALLVEVEKESSLTNPIQLRLGQVAVPRPDWSIPDPAWLRLLKFLQEPIFDPSSGKKRWRLPHLNSISLIDSRWLKGYLKQFVTAREVAFEGQTVDRITEILLENPAIPRINIFSEVMDYNGELP